MTVFKSAALAVVGGFWVAQSASAVYITHNNSQVFYDGFESNVTAFADLDPDPALWSIAETDQDQIQVLSVQENPLFQPASAYEGNNSLKVYRNAGTEANVFGTLSGGEKVTGDIHAEFAVFIPSNHPNGGTVPYSANFALTGGTGDNGFAPRRVWLSAFRDASDPNSGPVLGGNIKYYNADIGGWTNTGLTWTADQWQVWEIDLTLDPINPDMFTVTLNGNTSALLAVETAQQGAVDTFVARGTGEGSFFHLDAVPEPSTLALAALGLLALAGRRGGSPKPVRA